MYALVTNEGRSLLSFSQLLGYLKSKEIEGEQPEMIEQLFEMYGSQQEPDGPFELEEEEFLEMIEYIVEVAFHVRGNETLHTIGCCTCELCEMDAKMEADRDLEVVSSPTDQKSLLARRSFASQHHITDDQLRTLCKFKWSMLSKHTNFILKP